MRSFSLRLSVQNLQTAVLFQLLSPLANYFQSRANKTRAAQFTPMWVRSRRATRRLEWLAGTNNARVAIIDASEYGDGKPGLYPRLFACSRGARRQQSRFRAIGTYLRSGGFTARFAAHGVGKRRAGHPSRGISK